MTFSHLLIQLVSLEAIGLLFGHTMRERSNNKGQNIFFGWFPAFEQIIKNGNFLYSSAFRMIAIGDMHLHLIFNFLSLNFNVFDILLLIFFILLTLQFILNSF